MATPSDPDNARDTGLSCPWCGYNLTALTSNRCPECGERFVLSKPGALAKLAPKWFHIRSSGMPCPDCGQDNTAFMPSRCEACGRAFTWPERVFGTLYTRR